MSPWALALWCVAMPVALATTVFLAEVLLGLGKPRLADKCGQTGKTVVLMPAHDEAAGIGEVVRTVRSTAPEARVLVVADNCGDATAATARAAGADVIERFDPARRGKGFALAFGRDALRTDPPGCVVVIDADCVAEEGAIERIAALALARQRPVQGAYLLYPARDASPAVEISSFAFMVKNLVRQVGGQRLGAAAVLTGSGMAFPWALFAAAPLATADLAEDLAIGIHFTRAGHAPLFAAEAIFWSAASGVGGTRTQRERWETGFLDTARTAALPLLAAGLRRRSPVQAWLGLHLLTPPLAILVLAQFAVLTAAAVLAIADGALAPLMLLIILLSATAIAVLAAWWRHGRRWLAPRTILRLPAYLLWKIPISARALLGREKRWVRTQRDG